MKRNLLNIAMGLSEKELKELVRLKKDGSKKLTALRRERKKLQTALDKVDSEIAMFTGESVEPAAPKTAARGRRRAKAKAAPKARGAKKTVKKTAKIAKTAGKKAAKTAKTTARGGVKIKAGGLTNAVKQILGQSAQALRAGDIVEKLPEVGFKVKNEAALRKRVSIVLATQKKNFKQAGRGLYQIAD